MITASFARKLSRKSNRKTEEQVFLANILDEISSDIMRDAEQGARISVIQFEEKVLPSSFENKITEALKNNGFTFQFAIVEPYIERLQIEW